MNWSEFYGFFGLGLFVLALGLLSYFDLQSIEEPTIEEEDSPRKIYMTRYRERMMAEKSSKN